MRTVVVFVGILVFSGVCRSGHAEAGQGPSTVPTQAELEAAVGAAHTWADAAFAAPKQEPAPTDVLVVEDRRHLVRKNRSGWDSPLTLGDTLYDHGLYMDTPASVRVQLSRPVRAFTALVGIDSNENTKGASDRGSARFHVSVGGERVWSSPVLKLSHGATEVHVPLDNVGAFSLSVDDGGDGIAHDQCVWADAAVEFDDGSALLLDTLPLCGGSEPRRQSTPFSFEYGGVPSDVLLGKWEHTVREEAAQDGRLVIISYRDPASGLLVECHLRTYPDTAAVDWLCYLENTGDANTPIIEDFLPLDVASLFSDVATGRQVMLRWSHGDRHDQGKPTPASFMPFDEPLAIGTPRAFASHMTFEHLPFFNLMGPEGGWLVALGWTGKWRAAFRRDAIGGVTVQAGMQRSHFYLKPGERVRTPRVSLLRWCGDEMIHGHNQFRRHALAHLTPRLDGVPAEPPVAASAVAGLWIRARREGLGAPKERLTEASERAMIERLADAGCDVYWMDAYWFPQPWWSNYGNWFPRPEDFPKGLRVLSDLAHERGLKFILWFATQKAHANTTLAVEHPECFYGGEEGGLLKLGDPEARAVMTDWLSGRLREWDVDVYREDIVSELPPEPDPDRLGVPEMLHVEGFYKLWSDLKERKPGLLIDNCCGGGCKINLDTNCLSYVLWRSDLNDIGEGLKGPDYYPYMATSDQVHVTGLSLYLPFHTGPAWSACPYSLRSAMTSGIVFYEETDRDTFAWDEAKRGIAELKGLRPLFQGNLYPLLDLTTDHTEWYAYQLDRPDLGEGCALFFRRPESKVLMYEIALYGIDAEGTYEVSLTGETYDTGPWERMSGAKLARPEVIIREKPGSALLRYRRIVEP